MVERPTQHRKLGEILWSPHSVLTNAESIDKPETIAMQQPEIELSISSVSGATKQEFERVRRLLQRYKLERFVALSAEHPPESEASGTVSVGQIHLRPQIDGSTSAADAKKALTAYQTFAQKLFGRDKDSYALRTLEAALEISKKFPDLCAAEHLEPLGQGTLFFHKQRDATEDARFRSFEDINQPDDVKEILDRTRVSEAASEVARGVRRPGETGAGREGLRIVGYGESSKSVLEAIGFWFNLIKNLERLESQG